MTVAKCTGMDVAKVKAWMTLNNIKTKDLEKIMGLGRVRVLVLLEGNGFPRQEAARKLIDAANGQLTWDDIFPYIKYQPKKGAA